MRTFSQQYSQKLGQEIKQSQSEIGAAYSSIAHTVLLKVSSPTEALFKLLHVFEMPARLAQTQLLGLHPLRTSFSRSSLRPGNLHF